MTWAYPVLIGAAIVAGMLVGRWTRRPLPIGALQRLGLRRERFAAA